MTPTIHELHHCPACRRALNAIQRLAGAREPMAGGVSICFFCSAINVITNELTLRRPTEFELERYLADPQVKRALAAIAQIRRAH